MDKLNLLSSSRETSRAAAIEQLVERIREQDSNGAYSLLKHFQEKGEHVSREILAAYQHLANGCPPIFSELSIHGYRI